MRVSTCGDGVREYASCFFFFLVKMQAVRLGEGKDLGRTRA